MGAAREMHSLTLLVWVGTLGVFSIDNVINAQKGHVKIKLDMDIVQTMPSAVFVLYAYQ